MIDHEDYDRIARVPPILQRADPQLAHEFQQVAALVRIPAGHDVFFDFCVFAPLFGCPMSGAKIRAGK